MAPAGAWQPDPSSRRGVARAGCGAAFAAAVALGLYASLFDIASARAEANADRPSGPARAAPPDRPGQEGFIRLRAPTDEMVFIPAGRFVMGSTPEEIAYAIELCKREPLGSDECERDFVTEGEAHEVILAGYWIDRTEVTVAAYRRCVAAGRCAPRLLAGGARFDRPEYPASLVSWNEAVDYCRYAGGRLPTEAEWERAARGTEGRRFPWGNLFHRLLANRGELGYDQANDDDGFAELAPVRSFPAGRTPEGVYDLAGNVSEWVYDAIEDGRDMRYPPASEVNPTGAPSGAYHVIRGGSYQSGVAWIRGAARRFELASEQRPWLGFRCAKDAGSSFP